MRNFICIVYVCLQEELHCMLDDNIIFFSASSKSDRFQLHWVCKQTNNYVTLEAFLRSLRVLETRHSLSGKFSFLHCIQNRATLVHRCICNIRNCQKPNTLMDYGDLWLKSTSWNINTFSKFWVAVCYWLLWQESFPRITIAMAQKIIGYCIHHTKTSGYSIAHWSCYSTGDWTTEESRIDTRHG